ncbi:MAG: carbonic anhydrase [Deltaproteobacteria bacterium]|nr:carbonic anhydrase [Deltaproteobacteria bacterium]
MIKFSVLTFVLLLMTSAVVAKEANEPESTPKIALADLQAGNKRFSRGEPKHPDQQNAVREKLASGQHPPAIVLSCSDSRVPPELVFDQGLGRVFTIRVAGNILDPATVASIEYAVEHLDSKLVVVMGHENCGAVKAALETPAGTSAGSRDLDTLLSVVRTNMGKEKSVKGAVKSNVNAVAEDLMIRSKIVRDHVRSGKVAIVPAIYSLESGIVEFWNTGHVEDSR